MCFEISSSLSPSPHGPRQQNPAYKRLKTKALVEVEGALGVGYHTHPSPHLADPRAPRNSEPKIHWVLLRAQGSKPTSLVSQP